MPLHVLQQRDVEEGKRSVKGHTNIPWPGAVHLKLGRFGADVVELPSNDNAERTHFIDECLAFDKKTVLYGWRLWATRPGTMRFQLYRPEPLSNPPRDQRGSLDLEMKSYRPVVGAVNTVMCEWSWRFCSLVAACGRTGGPWACTTNDAPIRRPRSSPRDIVCTDSSVCASPLLR